MENLFEENVMILSNILKIASLKRGKIMLDFLKDQGLGFIIGILSTVLYEYKIKSLIQKLIRNKEKRKTHRINVFDEYKKGGNVIPVISYGDVNAIKIEPLMQYGKAILKAGIDISNRPLNYDNRCFVMALLKYISINDWSCYAELGYYFKFKVRGSIHGLQLEVKDKKGQKVIDEFIRVDESFKEYKINLADKKVDEVNEICFTVFCEEKYISKNTGRFEIYDCVIDNKS